MAMVIGWSRVPAGVMRPTPAARRSLSDRGPRRSDSRLLQAARRQPDASLGQSLRKRRKFKSYSR
eukprot:749941-Hanusia_phi.AAC.3